MDQDSYAGHSMQNCDSPEHLSDESIFYGTGEGLPFAIKLRTWHQGQIATLNLYLSVLK